MQLQIFHVHRLGALGQRRGCRYGAMQGAGHDDAPENAVIVQPRRVGWKHLRLVHHLAARRFVPRAQQRMAGAGASPPRRLNPIPLALKRIPWQFDPASFLTGEETRERNRETRLIRSRDRLQERFVAVRQGRIVGRAQHARQNRRLSCVASHVGPHERHQRAKHRVGADFDDQIDAQFRHGADAPAKLHRLPRVAPPVRGVKRRARLDRLAGHVAHQSHGRR